MTKADLARIVRVQAQTIGRTLARLEALDYLRREHDPSDRRSHVISITDAGAAARQNANALDTAMLAPLSLDAGTLRAELQTVVRELTARNKAGRTIH